MPAERPQGWDEAVEAAARAANLEAGRQRGLAFEDDWETLTEQERGGWRLCTRAALEAAWPVLEPNYAEFLEKLTTKLSAAGVPAMPSWAGAIDHLVLERDRLQRVLDALTGNRAVHAAAKRWLGPLYTGAWAEDRNAREALSAALAAAQAEADK